MREITNIEKNLDEIADIISDNIMIGVDKDTLKPFACRLRGCRDCIFEGLDCTQAIKNWLHAKHFNVNEWIGAYYKRANEDKNVKILLYDDQRTTIICGITGKTGRAVRHDNDEFVWEKGVAIAYARYKGIKIPHEVLG